MRTLGGRHANAFFSSSSPVTFRVGQERVAILSMGMMVVSMVLVMMLSVVSMTTMVSSVMMIDAVSTNGIEVGLEYVIGVVVFRLYVGIKSAETRRSVAGRWRVVRGFGSLVR